MLLDFLQINKEENNGLYASLYGKIKEAVQSSAIKPGERLPSIREAAEYLEISRTTVENAYVKLCIEGIAESRPCKGYYILKLPETGKKTSDFGGKPENKTPEFDFSARKIDPAAADTDRWKKTVREILRNNYELNSYGDPQGELSLRTALADYAYKARGVVTRPENIVMGAGIGPLLYLLCGIVGRNIKVAAEGGGFSQANRIFSDYGIETLTVRSDRSGALPAYLEKSGANVLFLLPSNMPKISVAEFSSRRQKFVNWANAEKDRFVIEDDYNGELRYFARTVTAFQPKLAEKTVYIGSFSKLLLPSVRIAYMVLPDFLAGKFFERRNTYNQTCGKIEQLALEKYISDGSLEKHLRRLRKLYSDKGRKFCELLETTFPHAEITLYESSVTVKLGLKTPVSSAELCAAAENEGVKIMPDRENGAVRLSFAEIETEKINPALTKLKAGFEKII